MNQSRCLIWNGSANTVKDCASRNLREVNAKVVRSWTGSQTWSSCPKQHLLTIGQDRPEWQALSAAVSIHVFLPMTSTRQGKHEWINPNPLYTHTNLWHKKYIHPFIGTNWWAIILAVRDSKWIDTASDTGTGPQSSSLHLSLSW